MVSWRRTAPPPAKTGGRNLAYAEDTEGELDDEDT